MLEHMVWLLNESTFQFSSGELAIAQNMMYQFMKLFPMFSILLYIRLRRLAHVYVEMYVLL